MKSINKKVRQLFRYTVLGAAVSVPSVAAAQGGGGFVLEEITVTARKIEENLQTTPVAVSAFSGAELEDIRGVFDVTDLSASAPNFSISGDAGVGGNSSAVVAFIRGIGQTEFNITSDPAVGIYVDGIYVAKGVGGLLDIVDLERVEVLRGPQGTLFGRNSIGGAINLISKKPGDEFEGKVAATVGEDGLFKVGGSVNLPLGDGVAARFAAMHTQQDGFVSTPFYDEDLGNKNSTTLRAAFRFNTDTFVADLVMDYSTSSQSPAPFTPAEIRGDANSPWIRGHNNNVTTADCSQGGADVNSSPDCFGNFYLQGPFSENGQFFDENGNVINPENDNDILGVGLTLEWDTALGTVKSVTGYRDAQSDFYSDLDHSPFLIFQIHNFNYETQTLTQELQLAGSTESGQFDYVAGAYYYDEEGLQQNLLQGPLACNDPGCTFQQDDRFSDVESTALYAQGTWHLTDSLHLTAGVRRTDSEKDVRLVIDRTFRVGAGGGAVSSSGGTLSTKVTDPLITLGWDATDTTYIYGTYTEGFREGGFPPRILGTGNIEDNYDEESVKSYELGLKSEFLEGALRANFAIFQTDYADYQVSASPVNLPLGLNVTSIDNLASITINGLEAELYWVVSDNFRADLSLGLLDGSIDELVGGQLSVSGATIDTSADVPYTPEYSGNLGLSHILPLGNSGEILTRLDVKFVDSMQTHIANVALTETEAYTSVNLSFTYTNPDESWEFVVGAKNLTDEDYFTTSTISGVNGNAVQTNVVRPRTAYATARYLF